MNNQSLDDQVLFIYDLIAKLPPEERSKALFAYWDRLSKTCTAENPCIECLREIRAQEASGD